MSTNLVTKKAKGSKLLNNILGSLNYGYRSEEEEAIEEFFRLYDVAKREMFDAQNFFDNVADPELIDHAIFRMEAAKTKFVYLIKQAKERGISLNL